MRDPRGIDYFSYANASLRLGDKANCVGGGDCDDFAILMSALVESIGGTTRIILAHNNTTGGHAYAEVYIGKLDSPNRQVNEIMDWLKQKYSADRIFTHVVTDIKDVWLNLDWGPDEKGNAHPGGPFYQGDKHIVICIRDTYQKTPLKIPASYHEQERQGSNVNPGNATISPAPATVPAPINETHAESWQKTFGGSNNDYAEAVQQTNDGGYIIAGTTNGPLDPLIITGGKVWLIKTDVNGNRLLDRIFGGSSNEEGDSVQQTSDGGYIIAGSIDTHAWLIKTDSAGNKLWDKTFGGSKVDVAESVQQTSDGGYIIAGQTRSYGAGNGDAWLIKTDSSGNELWDKTFGGSNDDEAHSVQQTRDGGYIIAADTESFGSGSYDAWLIKTDSDGNKLWDKTFGGPNFDAAYSVQQTGDGGYIIAGCIDTHAGLIKTDSSGNKLWDKTFGGSNNESPEDLAKSVQQTSDGGYIIAGRIDTHAGLIKTDSSGNKLWDKTFGGSKWDGTESVRQTSDGGYIIAGSTESYGSGGYDAWLIKTDANGN